LPCITPLLSRSPARCSLPRPAKWSGSASRAALRPRSSAPAAAASLGAPPRGRAAACPGGGARPPPLRRPRPPTPRLVLCSRAPHPVCFRGDSVPLLFLLLVVVHRVEAGQNARARYHFVGISPTPVSRGGCGDPRSERRRFVAI